MSSYMTLRELLLLQRGNRMRMPCNFNQPLGMGVLPAHLTHLTFGDDFNQQLDVGVLPDIRYWELRQYLLADKSLPNVLWDVVMEYLVGASHTKHRPS